MAEQTSKAYRNQVIYSVYVRNHTREGTFEGVRRDLPRIKELGADVIWLMPIHPIGKKARKGSPSGTTCPSIRSTEPWRTFAAWWTTSTAWA